jgi:hypothetical protein
VFLFPACTALSRAHRDTIDSLKSGGNLLVFGPGAGYIIGEDTSADEVSALLGMRIEIDNSIPWRIQRNPDAQHPLAKALPAFVGTDKAQPHIEVTSYRVIDPDAVPLGAAVNDQKDVNCAFKDNGTWQSVYLGSAGYFPPTLFRAMADLKGLHVYASSDDAMYFGKELVALHATTSGTKTIRLPHPCRVKSLWDGLDLGVLTEIQRDMRIGDTALYSCARKGDRLE